MIGYSEEEKPTIIVEGNPFRQLSVSLHLFGLTISDLKSEFNVKQANTVPKDKFATRITARIQNKEK